MAGSPRMSDVARLAGVSTMTVSRVLNGHQGVTPDTQRRVQAAVDRLRYRPNELAKSLRQQRTRQIGVIVPYLFDPFFAVCAHAISTVAQEHGYSVILSTSNEDAKTELREASYMLRRSVEGLILIPTHPVGLSSLMAGEEFRSAAIVSLDRPIAGSTFPSVLVDNEAGACAGTNHLVGLGHRRVAYIGLEDTLYTMEMRHRGYTRAMEEAGHTPQATLLSGALDDAHTAIHRLLRGRRPPTALFCANNLITRHVLHSLQALDLHPPEGLALVGFDDFETADLLRPGITVVRQPVAAMARQAAEMLLARLLGGEDAARKQSLQTFRTELVVRGSCGTPAAR